MKFNVGVVIVCAGRSRRLGRLDKTLLELKGKPLFFYTLNIFKKFKEIKQIVLVLRKKHFKFAKKIIKDRNVTLVEGGKERKDSVYNGLICLEQGINYVLIHDGARPFVSTKIVRDILKELKRYPAVISAIAVSDTLKLTKKSFIKKTLDRKNIYLAQTPQGFKKDLLLKAYKKFRRRKLTDDAQVVELMGRGVKIVKGDVTNIKVTYPEDIRLAEALSKIK